MPRKYPPLTPNEVCKIAQALGWQPHPSPPRTKGDHRHYLHPDVDPSDLEAYTQYSPLQVDMGEKDYGRPYLKNTIRRMGITRDQFYAATPAAAAKANIPYSPPPALSDQDSNRDPECSLTVKKVNVEDLALPRLKSFAKSQAGEVVAFEVSVNEVKRAEAVVIPQDPNVAIQPNESDYPQMIDTSAGGTLEPVDAVLRAFNELAGGAPL